VTITPDPSEPFEVVIITTDGTIWRYTSVTGSGVAVAAGVGVGVCDARSVDVAELDPSWYASAAMTTMAMTSTPAAATSQRQPPPYATFPGGCGDSGGWDRSEVSDAALGKAALALGARNPRSRPGPAGSIWTA
jgi:hypothetical protein